jgi:hypothetical protein
MQVIPFQFLAAGGVAGLRMTSAAFYVFIFARLARVFHGTEGDVRESI